MIGYDEYYDRFTRDGFAFTEREDEDLLRLAEERADKHIGRWRDPEHRVYVVYPLADDDPSGRKVRVVNELTGDAGIFWDRSTSGAILENRRVALNYFKAHPVRKPWHDAAPSEVWVVTRESGTVLPMFVRADYGEVHKFAHINGLVYAVNDGGIAEANRIWPVTNEEEK